VQDIHLLATIIHPQLKHFDQNPTHKQQASELLQAQIEQRSRTIHSSSIASQLQSLPAVTDAADIASSITAEGNISEKKRKNLLSLCFDKPRSSTSSMDEFNSWMSSTLTLDDGESEDILRFWSQYGHLFPTIAAIARDAIAIPASNTCVERLFSKSKAMITDKRTNMGVEKIDRMLFLRKNLNILKKISDQQTYEDEQMGIKRKVNQEINELLDACSKKSKTKEINEIVNEEEIVLS
jgi:hypothetical protein